MDRKRSLSFVFTITAIIIGAALFRGFDFQNFTFKKPALAIVYIIGFVISIAFLFKKQKGK